MPSRARNPFDRGPACGLLAGCVAAAALAGCGGPPKLYHVSGTVKIDGKPAEMVMVYFWPVEMSDKKNFVYHHAIGVTDGQGHFQLKSGAGAEGIPAGDYKVTFSRPMARGKPVAGETKKADESGAIETIPVRFREIDQTPVAATVSEAQRDFTFEIASK